MTTLYVAGPMTGLPEYNYPAFDAAARDLAAVGYDVLNPARHGVVEGWTWRDYMRHALRDVVDADGLALLPGWQASKGATLEVHVGQALGLKALPVSAWLAASAAVCEQCQHDGAVHDDEWGCAVTSTSGRRCLCAAYFAPVSA